MGEPLDLTDSLIDENRTLRDRRDALAREVEALRARAAVTSDARAPFGGEPRLRDEPRGVEGERLGAEDPPRTSAQRSAVSAGAELPSAAAYRPPDRLRAYILELADDVAGALATHAPPELLRARLAHFITEVQRLTAQNQALEHEAKAHLESVRILESKLFQLEKLNKVYERIAPENRIGLPGGYGN